MPSDFRVSVGFHDHPKTIKLERALGEGAPMNLQRLWGHATEFKPSGVLSGMDAEDIAIAAKWKGEADLFVDTLVRLRWVDRQEDGTLVLHDWHEHNGFVATSPERSEQARAAAQERWKGKGKKGAASGSNAGRNARGTKAHAGSNAPYPNPSPNPSPSPTPDRTGGSRASARTHANGRPEAEGGIVLEVEAEEVGRPRGMGSAEPAGAADVATGFGPAGPAGLPKGPQVPIAEAALAAVAAVLPPGSLCRPDQAPAQVYSILKVEYPHQDYPLVHARWRELGPDGQAVWCAEALGRPEVKGKKTADQWRSATRHIGRALHDGFDLLAEDRSEKVVDHPAARPRPARPQAGGGRMSNQERTMAILREAAAEAGGAS